MVGKKINLDLIMFDDIVIYCFDYIVKIIEFLFFFDVLNNLVIDDKIVIDD